VLGDYNGLTTLRHMIHYSEALGFELRSSHLPHGRPSDI
jgi:hypothetical protein